MTTCAVCNTPKPDKDFSPYSLRAKYPSEKRCRLCNRKRKRKYEHNAVGKWNTTRRSAQKRGIEFTLTIDQVADILQRPCVYGSWIHSLETHVGIDRKDNSVGYLYENCVPCCGRHNVIKGGWFTYNQMLEIVALHPLLRRCGTGGGGKPFDKSF